MKDKEHCFSPSV